MKGQGAAARAIPVDEAIGARRQGYTWREVAAVLNCRHNERWEWQSVERRVRLTLRTETT